MLETARLRLLPWSSEDWLALAPIARDPEVVRYISNGQPWADARIQDFVQRQVAVFAQRGFCFWRLLPKRTLEAQGAEQMIGFCGFAAAARNE